MTSLKSFIPLRILLIFIIIDVIHFTLHLNKTSAQTLDFPYFDTLPSEQGWTYRSDCDDTLFYLSDSLLVQNTINKGAVRGLFLIERGSLIIPGKGWTLRIKARVLQLEDSSRTSGFFFNVVQENWLYSVRLTPTKIYIADVYPEIYTVISFDNTCFNEFILTRESGAKWTLIVNDKLMAEGIPVPASSYTYIEYDLAFGDGTSNEHVNAHGEWASYTFCQDYTAVKSKNIVIPARWSLFQNYPNPFNSNTAIEYKLTKTAFVNLVVYDLNGKEVRELISNFKSQGNHLVIWDGYDDARKMVGSGTYFYQIKIWEEGSEAQSFMDVKKLLLIK